MPTTPSPKLIAPGESRTVQLYGVRFDYKVVGADSGGTLALLEVEIPTGTLVKPRGTPHAMWNTEGTPARVLEIVAPAGLENYFEELPPILRHEGGAGRAEYEALAERYGIVILDDWIEELERTYGVKL